MLAFFWFTDYVPIMFKKEYSHPGIVTTDTDSISATSFQGLLCIRYCNKQITKSYVLIHTPHMYSVDFYYVLTRYALINKCILTGTVITYPVRRSPTVLLWLSSPHEKGAHTVAWVVAPLGDSCNAIQVSSFTNDAYHAICGSITLGIFVTLSVDIHVYGTRLQYNVNKPHVMILTNCMYYRKNYNFYPESFKRCV